MFAKPYAQTIPPIGLGAEDLRTWADGVTLLRTVAGLAVYWGLNVLDGFLARRLNWLPLDKFVNSGAATRP